MRKATIVSQFWNRGTGRALRGNKDAQILALYLFTCPAGNEFGLFYLPLATILAETGLTADECQNAFKAVCDTGAICYDFTCELVWIPKSAHYQGAAASKSATKIRSAKTALECVGDHAFGNEFRAAYPSLCGLDLPAPPTEKSATLLGKSRGNHQLPSDWSPTDEHKERAAELGVNWAYEAMKFRAHAEEKGREAISWNGAFTRWLMNAAEYRGTPRKQEPDVIEWTR